MDVAEALLHVRNGDWFLCLLVANVPDSFNEGNSSVSTQHIMSSDNVRESGRLIASTSFIWLVSVPAVAELDLYLTLPHRLPVIVSL